MNKLRLVAALALLSVVFAQEAKSDIVFDNGAGDPANFQIFVSDASTPIGEVRSADDVMFMDSQYQITDVEWTGTYFVDGSGTTPTSPTDAFSIAIFLDNGGMPAATPLVTFDVGDAVNRSATGVNTTNGSGAFNSVFEYSAEIDFAMDVGTKYWVSVLNDPTGNDATFYWTGQTPSNGNSHITVDGGANWVDLGGNLDYRLHGFPVPEPGSAMVLLILSSAFLKRKRVD